jgi:hypothetical protein
MWVKLCDEVVRINERICDLRPVPEMKNDQELAALKKITEGIYEEIQKEIGRIVSRYAMEKKASVPGCDN